MKIGIIGAGQVGSALARKFVGAGYPVLIANSRGSDSIQTLADDIGAKAVSVRDVTKDVGIVIIAIPEKSIPSLPADIFDGVADDVVLIDTGNYYPARDGVIGDIERGMPESVWVSRHLGRPVVKAFNNLVAYSMAHAGMPQGTKARRVALPVAGGHAEAKAVASELVEAMGFDCVDAGGLEESWRQQPGSPVWCTDLDFDGVTMGLASADRTRLPELRDAGLKEISKLPRTATPADITAVLRSLY